MRTAIATAAALAVVAWSGQARAHCDEKKAPHARVETKSTISGTGGSGEVSVRPDYAPGYEVKKPLRLGERTSRAMTGLTVFAGGGVEGYAGSLRSDLKPGPAWNVTAAAKPSKAIGFELGYSGAVNETREQNVGELAGGPDIIRNGANLSVTAGLPTAIQPYVLGGIGFNHFTARGNSSQFQSDNAGNIPLGVGLRTHVANFTADLRGNYNLGFDEEFASAQGRRSTLGVKTGNAGRYDGMLSLGASF
jgi:hypothetical protein